MAGPGRSAVAAAALLAAVSARPAPAEAPGKDEVAVRALFPGADRVEARDVLLTDAMVSRIEALARARVKERLVTFYVASAGGAVSGY
ncbi:MAG TPA: FMN-binding protein, partial [Anaeromyxobacter sp.]